MKKGIWSGSSNGHLEKRIPRFKACSTKIFHVHTYKSMTLDSLDNLNQSSGFHVSYPQA